MQGFYDCFIKFCLALNSNQSIKKVIEMKLRTKFLLAFILMTVIPTLLLMIVLFSIGFVHIKMIENRCDVDDINYEYIINPTKIYSKITEKDYKVILKKIKEDPGCFEDIDYLEQINDELKKKKSFIIVKKGEEFLLNGLEGEINLDILKRMEVHTYPDGYEENVYIYGDSKYFVKQVMFNYDDGDIGEVFIVTDYEMFVRQIKRMIIEMFLSMILVIMITGVVFSLWIKRSILKPIYSLENAARKIAEGELDFEVKKECNDEIGELVDEFENMRIRLRNSADERLNDDKESRELISNISHDLKTPITAIKGYVEGIMDGVADTPEKMDKYIKTIYNKANDMDKLIGELTMFSKIDTNRIPYNFAKVNVEEYFSDFREEASVELESRNISLNYFNYTDKDTIIIADPEQLKRVINNIVSNSVKYIDKKKGALNIRINDENDFIHVEIEDNGKGIEQKDLPKIFDRFYRTDHSRNSKQGGSGIGLAISRKIIEMHGGRIWATSKLGTGTTIHFIIRKYYEPEVKENEQDINSGR